MIQKMNENIRENITVKPRKNVENDSDKRNIREEFDLKVLS